jgi:hypothetical protein
MHLSALLALLASILGAGHLYPVILPHPHGAAPRPPNERTRRAKFLSARRNIPLMS